MTMSLTSMTHKHGQRETTLPTNAKNWNEHEMTNFTKKWTLLHLDLYIKQCHFHLLIFSFFISLVGIYLLTLSSSDDTNRFQMSFTKDLFIIKWFGCVIDVYLVNIESYVVGKNKNLTWVEVPTNLTHTLGLLFDLCSMELWPAFW